MPVPVPVRSSTFILDNPVSTNNDESSSKNITFELPARSNTFTIDENVSEELYSRRSLLRFAPDPALLKESTTKQAANKIEKSIGKRIFANSKVQSIKKCNAGSSVKKTITKNTIKPGSVFGKKTGPKKLPNFKSIHQRLFSNMESLVDYQKRKQKRAQALLLSSAPRCAAPLQSPRNLLLKQTPSPIPLTRIENQMSTAKTPRTVSTKPLVTLTKPMKSEATAVNRFGFKRRVTKAEANTIAGKKLPPVTMQKRKEQDRKFIHGVRTNKRFMLQMQMRMGQSEN